MNRGRARAFPPNGGKPRVRLAAIGASNDRRQRPPRSPLKWLRDRMRCLILSDIHANLEALEAVTAAVAGEYDCCLCLGDVVGYGASPNECAEWTRRHTALTIRGNHDRACVTLEALEDLSPLARQSTLWTAPRLTPATRKYLESLPAGPVAREGAVLAHGSPRDEDEYILDAAQAAAALADGAAGLTFFGHTHLQGGWRRLDGNGMAKAVGGPAHPAPSDVAMIAPLDPTRCAARRDAGSNSHGPIARWRARLGRTTRAAADGARSESIPPLGAGESSAAFLINPGSVGQPRDRDWRAAALLYEAERREIEYLRVPYDVAAAQAKILAAGLPKRLAERLAAGW